MEKYNYYEEVKNCVIDYYNEHLTRYEDLERYELEEYLFDDCFNADDVTGNRSGSFTLNAWEADECLCHNNGILYNAIMESGGNFDTFETCLTSSETADVIVRCYVLRDAVNNALDELGM